MEVLLTSSEYWLQIRGVLDAALNLPAERRPDFVASQCPNDTLRHRVFSILAAYEDGLSLQLDPAAPEPAPHETGAAPGERIGPYLLVEKRGEGGMGAVFLATRADQTFDKKVAIKLLKRGWGGAEEARRFRVERQILADLEHPNIAKLLDGGSTAAGQPYFVMEFVEGAPIDEYCDRNGLALDERLALFLEVCAAVQFAHQNLIVHRDLKPGNILVGEDGRPRLLDFGIAKILSPEFAETIAETLVGVAPMTPQYASPEQVRGEAISTASDVYSLGILLYRLLTGLPPYHFDSRDMKAVVDAVCHHDVLSPSARLKQGSSGRRHRALAARLAGDLDAIVLQALAKDPARRYPTAEQLADDLRRHLARKPVRARGGALAYRAGRFVQRHRLALGAAALVFLILVGSLVVLLGQRKDLIAERNRAVTERSRAETVSSWLVDLFGLPDPGRALGEKVTARELLDRSSAAIRTRLAAEPELLATLLATLGETYENLGQLPEANEHLATAITYLRQTGAGDGRLAEALRRLAEIQRQQFKLMPARKTATAALLHAEKAFGPDSPLAVRCRTQLAQIESQIGNLDAAAAHFDLALEKARTFPDQLALAEVLEYRGELLQIRGDNEEANASYQQALQIQRLLHEPGHPQIAKLESKMASALVHTEPLRAEAELRAKAAQQREQYGDAHPYLVGTLGNLGLALFDQGKLDESEAYFNEALAMARKLNGGRFGRTGALLINLGNIAARRGDLDKADRLYREAIDNERQESGEQTATFALYTHYLAQLELNRGHVAEARRLTEAALATTAATIGSENLQTMLMLTNMAEIRRIEGKPEDGIAILRRAAAIGRQASGWATQLRAVLHALAVAEYGAGQLTDARGHFEEVAATTGYDPNLGLWAATYLAATENKLGRPQEAEKWARQALEGYARSGETGAWPNSVHRELGLALGAQGRFPEAAAELKHYLENLPAGTAEDKVAPIRTRLAEFAALEAARGNENAGRAP